jgi:hypothetical protein
MLKFLKKRKTAFGFRPICRVNPLALSLICLPAAWRSFTRAQFRDPFTESGRTEKRACKPVARKRKSLELFTWNASKKPNGKYQLSHNPGGMSDAAMTAARKHPAWNDRRSLGSVIPSGRKRVPKSE